MLAKALEKEQSSKEVTQETKVENTAKYEKKSLAPTQTNNTEKPVFKIQILTSDTPLKSTDKQLQGYQNVESYQEIKGGMIKYTCMPTTDYNQAVTNQKEIRKKNPGAFMVAFKNGKRIDLGEAVAEFKSNKNK